MKIVRWLSVALRSLFHFLLVILLFAQFSVAQPGKGGGNGGGNGGGPGGGNGNDPCLSPKPPKYCNNVPINVDLLLVLGALSGIYFEIKTRSNSKADSVS